MEENQTTSTINRDHFSALPVHIRHHILTYLKSEFVRCDVHGNVLYIGQAALGEGTTPARFKRGLSLYLHGHGFAQVSREFREDFLDLFFSLNKFEFGSGPRLIEFLDVMLDDRRVKQLTSLRFTLRSRATVATSARSIKLMRRIYELFFLCVNLKELEVRAQVHWKSTGGRTQSLTFPVEDALSHFQGESLKASPMSFGDMIEKAPRRHGYNEDPRQLAGLDLPPVDLRAECEHVQGIVTSAYDMVMKKRQEKQRPKQQRKGKRSRPITKIQELTGAEAQERSPSPHPWRDLYLQSHEAMHAGPSDVEVAVPLEPGLIGSLPEHPVGEMFMPRTYPARCPTHHEIFHPRCSICKSEWEQEMDLKVKRSVHLQPLPPQASPQTSLNVDPSDPGSFSPWCPNHHGIIEPTCPRCTAEGSVKLDLAKGRIMQQHLSLPRADLSEPMATGLSTPAYSSPSHDMLAEEVHSWLDLSSPLYPMPTRDSNMFAYYLAMMEWAWDNGLEQSRVDAMTRAILARVDKVAFQAWLYTPSGIPDPRETKFGPWERRIDLDSLY